MSADGYNIIEASIFFHLLWSNPFQIGISIYMLYEILGVSVFVGMSNIYFQTIKFVEFCSSFQQRNGCSGRSLSIQHPCMERFGYISSCSDGKERPESETYH